MKEEDRPYKNERKQSNDALRGVSFNYKYLGENIKFTITRDWRNALRVIINDSIQAIWLPKACLYINDKKISVKSIDWKLKTKEFKHKLDLSKDCERYHERHSFYKELEE